MRVTATLIWAETPDIQYLNTWFDLYPTNDVCRSNGHILGLHIFHEIISKFWMLMSPVTSTLSTITHATLQCSGLYKKKKKLSKTETKVIPRLRVLIPDILLTIKWKRSFETAFYLDWTTREYDCAIGCRLQHNYCEKQLIKITTRINYTRPYCLFNENKKRWKSSCAKVIRIFCFLIQKALVSWTNFSFIFISGYPKIY